MNFWRMRRLVGTIDAGEVQQLAAPGLGVKPFDVAGLHDIKGGIDEDLDEVDVAHHVARHGAFGAEG
ncbi:hypothetical protein D3C78_1979530 [compost metagenome]